MKNVIIFEDDFRIAALLKEKINELTDYQCEAVFSNPIEFLENPIPADIY